MKIFLVVLIFLVICFLYAHRYVIQARIKHEPMPKLSVKKHPKNKQLSLHDNP